MHLSGQVQKLLTTRERRVEESAEVKSAEEPTVEEKSAEAKSAEEQMAEDQLDDDALSDVVEVLGGGEGELSAGEQPTTLGYHARLPSISYSTLLDDAEADVDLPELDPDMHADPEHRWDIATMTVKEALASWEGKAVKAAMDEEIKSLITNGTWELVERSRDVNIMKNCWVLMTKYHVDDTVACEKARLVVKGFMQVYGAEYDETYMPVGSYVTLRIFFRIIAVFGLHLMQLDMKNAFM
ncbi:unnamed protein product [Closterium sp. NIES-54]